VAIISDAALILVEHRIAFIDGRWFNRTSTLPQPMVAKRSRLDETRLTGTAPEKTNLHNRRC
jgi:hypothetical protein